MMICQEVNKGIGLSTLYMRKIFAGNDQIGYIFYAKFGLFLNPESNQLKKSKNISILCFECVGHVFWHFRCLSIV